MVPNFSDRKSWYRYQLFFRFFTKNSLDLVNLFSVPWGYRIFAKKLLVPNFGTVWYQKKTVIHAQTILVGLLFTNIYTWKNVRKVAQSTGFSNELSVSDLSWWTSIYASSNWCKCDVKCSSYCFRSMREIRAEN